MAPPQAPPPKEGGGVDGSGDPVWISARTKSRNFLNKFLTVRQKRKKQRPVLDIARCRLWLAVGPVLQPSSGGSRLPPSVQTVVPLPAQAFPPRPPIPGPALLALPVGDICPGPLVRSLVAPAPPRLQRPGRGRLAASGGRAPVGCAGPLP